MKWLAIGAIFLLSCGQNRGRENAVMPDSTASQKPTTDNRTEARTEPSGDRLIVPGEKIGKVSIGMEATKLESLLGKPDSSDAAMGKAVLTWMNKSDNNQLKVYTAYRDDDMKDKSIQMIYATSTYFKTVEGFGAGSSLSDLQKAYPDLKKLKSYSTGVLYELPGKGLSFELANQENDAICTGVIIYPPDRLVTSLYVYLHPNLTYIE